MERRFDHLRPFHHHPPQLFNHFTVVLIDNVILAANLSRRLNILVDQRVERLMHHLHGQLGHAIQRDRDRKVGEVGDALGPLSNVHGKVGDSFQFGIDF